MGNRQSNGVTSYLNRMIVPPAQKVHRSRPIQRHTPGKITALPIRTRTDEEIIMRDIELAMTAIGLLAMAGVVIGVLALVAYWTNPWVVLSIVSAALFGYMVIKIIKNRRNKKC